VTNIEIDVPAITALISQDKDSVTTELQPNLTVSEGLPSAKVLPSRKLVVSCSLHLSIFVYSFNAHFDSNMKDLRHSVSVLIMSLLLLSLSFIS
jgi:hypothetical protein